MADLSPSPCPRSTTRSGSPWGSPSSREPPSPWGRPPPLVSAWDRCLARRAAMVGAVAVLTALIVVAATDAGGPWSLRLGMTAALAPLCGALGTVATVRVAEARGELRALAAVGAESWRAAWGAVAGGSAVGLAGSAVAASGAANLAALFPQEGTVRRWVVEGDGRAVLETTLGLRVGAGGELSLVAPQAVVAALPTGATGFAIATIAAASVGLPVWLVVAGGSVARKLATGGLIAVVSILAFRGVSAGLAPAAVLLVAPLLLIGDAAVTVLKARGGGE